MKNHGDFIAELATYFDRRMPTLGKSFNLDTVHEIVKMSRMGIAPEGAGNPIANKIVDFIYSNPSLSAPSVESAPIPPPPVNEKTETEQPTHFVLSQRSKDELAPVHPKLRRCVELAITYCTVDFRVNQGLRTIEEQRKAVASGNSRTMKSKHLKQGDGFAWAVDLVVLTNGKVDWTFETYANIALAMDKAATELGIEHHIRWGCAWDRVLADFGGSPKAYLEEANAYAKRHAGSDLLDAPHFEWVP